MIMALCAKVPGLFMSRVNRGATLKKTPSLIQITDDTSTSHESSDYPGLEGAEKLQEVRKAVHEAAADKDFPELAQELLNALI